MLNRLVDKGNTVIVIEHNMDVVGSRPYTFSPEGAKRRRSGMCGTPEEIMKKVLAIRPNT